MEDSEFYWGYDLAAEYDLCEAYEFMFDTFVEEGLTDRDAADCTLEVLGIL